MVRISKQEFQQRVVKVQEKMAEWNLDVLFVYGDEYRKENLRYITNYWPIFERGAAVVSPDGDPIVLCAPEGEEVAKEMSPWKDVRNVKDFACVTVPEEIDYQFAKYTSFSDIAREMSSKRKPRRIGVVGVDAMPVTIYQSLKKAFGAAELVDANRILVDLRLIKSKSEVECLSEAARLADLGYQALMETSVPGKTELQAAASAEFAARNGGAEDIVFTVFGSGKRTGTIVGRPTSKVIKKGDMIMASFAVQYEGYVATVEFPFVAGAKPTSQQKEIIDTLILAEERGLPKLKAGAEAKEFVKAVRGYYEEKGFGKYSVYTPLHGIGLSEAEAPYPNERSKLVFKSGMTVNVDISLFGHPAGSNRLEEGFVLTEKGAQPLSKLVRKLCQEMHP